MYKIEYTSLNYYHSPISEECLCLGVLFHNLSTGERNFRYISNFRRFHAFDDEADIDFVKLYLSGIKAEVEDSLFNYKNQFDLASYIRVYANEFRFSTIKTMTVSKEEDYVDNLTKLYLKYDLNKSQRLNDKEEKKLIRRIFEDNDIEYSTGKLNGPYSDEITFDYQVGNYCVKLFSFKGESIKRSINEARKWAFIADEVKPSKQVIFIYRADSSDQNNLDIILNILSKNAKVYKYDDGLDYILKHCA